MDEITDEAIDNEVDQIQEEIQKIEEKEIQEEYEHSRPVYISFLKWITIVSILYLCYYFITLYINKIDMSIMGPLLIGFIVLLAFFISGLTTRKRWAWWFGLILFGLGIIGSILLSIPTNIPFDIVNFLILAMHKDYLNK